MLVINNYYLIKSRFILLFLLIIIYLCIASVNVKAKELFFDKHKKIVVLDPGHGGHDTGAHGPEGTYEKTVALTLARMLASELRDKYRVFLTRTDDYLVAISERTALANHKEADLFISIHAGGSFLHQAGGMSVYYYKEISQALLNETADKEKLKNSHDLIPWDDLQKRHKPASKVLAKLMQHHLNKKIKHIETRIEGMPLIVLSGVDMPAILIETGYLTNPLEEKKMLDAKVLADLTKAISNGIDDFLLKKQ
ncbi:MAG: N-acetylmuramoyl-L-alanine amidase [Deltaproteobacteria bacterium]|nr:N-acetylmuramoyl-L-alanine amidase [Deltaproteobacteria bacterium]MBW2663035.1 N-acetylmuramoyl-L-alanine amidase [Deltaproteobacteria bacterium]